MQRLWIIAGSVVTVVVLAAATLNVVGVVAHEEVTDEAVFDATGVTAVDIRGDHVTIEVVGGDVESISLVADISHGLRRTEHRAEVVGDTLVVRSECPFPAYTWCRVDYRVVVPAALAVDAESDNGRVTVRDVNGDVTADSDNGRIELARLEGNVTASTDNGSVRASGLRSPLVTATSHNGSVRLSFAEAPTTVTARTSNGSVEVVVPDDAASYRVDVDTDNGSTDAGVRTDPASDRTIVATTRNGSVRVLYPTG